MTGQKMVDPLEPFDLGPDLNEIFITPLKAEELPMKDGLITPAKTEELPPTDGLQTESPSKKRSKWYLVRALRNMMSTKFDAKFTKLTSASRISAEFLYRTGIERRDS
jgi:hypothetical protein